MAASLPGRRLAGFYTEEIRVGGERRGFRAVTFEGAARIMAHVEVRGPQRVGKYGVDVPAIDALAESALAGSRAADLYLVDEIGRMECLSPRFVAAMRRILDGPTPVVAAVARTGGGFIAEVKRRVGAELWQVTRATRDDLPPRVCRWLEATR